ncbi:hypothetical protein EDC01DRAFT_473356 [Geopyxis carbonaria]|nr:hypothetical protein EDC01DRAFT_473356 [Geopyxis carbonaria]
MEAIFFFILVSKTPQVAAKAYQRHIGGLQLVLSGDFFQLSPIQPQGTRKCYKCMVHPPKTKNQRFTSFSKINSNESSESTHIASSLSNSCGVDPERWATCSHTTGDSVCGQPYNDSANEIQIGSKHSTSLSTVISQSLH